MLTATLARAVRLTLYHWFWNYHRLSRAVTLFKMIYPGKRDAR
jgi:hypothetical protein